MKTTSKVILIVLAIALISASVFFVSANNSNNILEKNLKEFPIKLISDDSNEIEEIEDENEKEDVPITGSSLEKASKKALEYIGEGKVTDSEIGDEEGYYEIEITLNNGKEVDVHLDENFNILSVEYE